MRGALSLFLVSFVAIQPVLGQDPAPNRKLQDVLKNVHDEATRFSKLHALEFVNHQEDSQERSASRVERIRTLVFDTSIGTEVTVTLIDGEIFEGKLIDATESHFSLRIQGTNKEFDFKEIRTFWIGPDLREIQRGKKIELWLVWDYKVEGRLTEVDDQGVTLDHRRFRFDEIVGVKELGIPTVYKVLIPVGALFGLLIYCSAGYCSQ